VSGQPCQGSMAASEPCKQGTCSPFGGVCHGHRQELIPVQGSCHATCPRVASPRELDKLWDKEAPCAYALPFGARAQLCGRRGASMCAWSSFDNKGRFGKGSGPELVIDTTYQRCELVRVHKPIESFEQVNPLFLVLIGWHMVVQVLYKAVEKHRKWNLITTVRYKDSGSGCRAYIHK